MKKPLTRRSFLKSAAIAAGASVVASTGLAAARDQVTETAAAAAGAKARLDPYSAENKIKIAYIAHDISTPNNQGWLEGIQRECSAWENIEILQYDAQEDAVKQASYVTDAVNQGCAAIILQCSDGTALAPAVDEAEAAGVPVVTVNLDAYTVHSGLVMAVDYDAGRMAADEMAKQMGGKGNVVIIEGVAGLSRTDNLEQGFKDTIAKYPDIKVLDAQPANFQKETATTVMNSFMQNYPEIHGVFAINDAMAEGAALAVDSAGKTGTMFIWGADGEKDALTMIENGQMAGTIYTNSWDEGSTAAKLALFLIDSEYSYTCLTKTPQMIMECVVVTKETVGSIPEADRW
ncbi:MAG: sugar ABC transporter substrate-binding protein [Clostridiales bacterium]|nr:sugar ABC transporter substrate-binding protein [Clostridiales bacterium]MDY5515394.1 sugar ABC transporter substrate-binding protein [Candidatus Ventricola sp.]